MSTQDDVTGTGTGSGQSEHDKALRVLKSLNVSYEKGTGRWTSADLQLLAVGLEKVPAFDRGILSGVTVVRDSALGPASGLSHHPGIEAARCSRSDLGTTVHMHLADAAFTNTDPLWGAFGASKTVVHETGHIRVMVSEVAADTAMREALARLLAAKRTAEASVVAVSVSNTDQALTTFVNDNLVDCWTDVCRTADAPANTAATAVARTRYPGPPDPGPGVWARAVADIHDQVQEARNSYQRAVAELTKTAEALRTLVTEKPARKGGLIVTQCTEAIRNASLALRELDSYITAVAAMGATRRQIEYFVWKMAHLGQVGTPNGSFPAFNAYSRSAHVEWFAEAYALAALNPAGMKAMNPAAATWFIDGLPGLPTDLEPLT
jgi:hypothetical protein